MRTISIRKLTLNFLGAVAIFSLGAYSLLASTIVSSSVVLTITSPSTIYFGQNVDGFAQVNSSDGSKLTGTIAFYDGSSTICVISTAVNATCPASAGANFSAGVHLVHAEYSGDTEHSGAISNEVDVTILQDSTATSISSTNSSLSYGQNVIFTATVRGVHGTPSGTVRFLDSMNELGSEALALNGTATLSVSALSPGTHAITAEYEGTQNSASSTSGVLNEVIQSQVVSPSFTISAAPVTVEVGQTANVTVKITPINGFNQPVQLACTHLPSESSCTFGSPMVRTGGGSTTLLLSTMAPHDCGSSTSYYGSLPYTTPIAAGLIILLFPGKRPRRRMKGLLMILAAFCGLTAITGCGNCTDLGTKPGTYTINVVGTSQGSTSMTISQKITLKVIY